MHSMIRKCKWMERKRSTLISPGNNSVDYSGWMGLAVVLEVLRMDRESHPIPWSMLAPEWFDLLCIWNAEWFNWLLGIRGFGCRRNILLTVFGGKFVHPAQFVFAIFAEDIAHHMTARQHHSILNGCECQIDHTFEQKCTTCIKWKTKNKNENSRSSTSTITMEHKNQMCKYFMFFFIRHIPFART